MSNEMNGNEGRASQAPLVSPMLFTGNVAVRTVRYDDDVSISLITALEDRILWNEESAEAQRTLAALALITGASFDGKPSDVAEGTKAMLQGSDGLAILHDREELLGFASSIFSREGIFYLRGIMAAPRIKGKNASRRMIKLLWNLSGAYDIALVTQNPVMFCLLRSMCHLVYPSPNQEVPESLRAKMIALRRSGKGALDSVTGVIQGIYDECLYPQIPKSNDSEVNSWFDEMLKIEDGKTKHAFLFIGRDHK